MDCHHVDGKGFSVVDDNVIDLEQRDLPTGIVRVEKRRKRLPS